MWLLVGGRAQGPQAESGPTPAAAPVTAAPPTAPAPALPETRAPVNAPRWAPEAERGAAPAAPSAPAAPGGAVSAADTFAAEARDSGWASDNEAEISRRLDALATGGATVEAVECRSRQCRILLSAPDEETLGALMTAVQGDRGLLGYAESVVLSRVDVAADGTQRTNVYAQFER